MIITTTDNVGTRKIRSYLGVVSGTDIYMVGGLIGGGLISQEGLYTSALSKAISKMKQKAEDLGADAIIGVSTNLSSPGNVNYMIVTVTGTAVITFGPAEYEWDNVPFPAFDAVLSAEGRYECKYMSNAEDILTTAMSDRINIHRFRVIRDKLRDLDFVQLDFTNVYSETIDSVEFDISLYDGEGEQINSDTYIFNGEYTVNKRCAGNRTNTGKNNVARATVGVKYAHGISEIPPVTVEEISEGWIVCPNCMTRQQSSENCKRCETSFEIIKYKGEKTQIKEGGWIVCPKCGTRQQASKRCKRCDVLLDLRKDNIETEAKTGPRDEAMYAQWDERGYMICPTCNKVQTKKGVCYNCGQKLILKPPAEETAETVIAVKDTSDTPITNADPYFMPVNVSEDSEGWIVCPSCMTKQKSSASCKRCGQLLNVENRADLIPEMPEDENVAELISLEPGEVLVELDENGHITCPTCSKTQTKKNICYVCGQKFRIKE